jgi:CheY-like chemotaxis protein
VLVVEDDAMICMLLEDMLGELGYIIAAEAPALHRRGAFHVTSAFSTAH